MLDISGGYSRVAIECEVDAAEVAQLDLCISGSPEVESNHRPDRSSICEVKDDRGWGDLARHNVEGIGAEGVH